MNGARPQLLALMLLVVLAMGTACAQTRVRGRDVVRMGPFRAGKVVPIDVDAGRIPIKGPRTMLDKTERRALDTSLWLAFNDELDDAQDEAKLRVGRARLIKCSVKASLGRANTIYKAKCRAALEIDGTAVVEVEGHAVRRVRSTAITEWQAARLKAGERNPQYNFADSEAVLLSAVEVCARLLVEADSVRDTDRPKDAPKIDPVFQRQASLNALGRAERYPDRAAAIIDIGRFGGPEDAAQVIPHLDDPEPLVRRAAASTLGELGPPDAIVPLSKTAHDPDGTVRREAERGLRRLCAIYGGQLVAEAVAAQPVAASSKSSGAGGGEAGSTPRSDKNASTWRQNEACSNR